MWEDMTERLVSCGLNRDTADRIRMKYIAMDDYDGLERFVKLNETLFLVNEVYAKEARPCQDI